MSLLDDLPLGAAVGLDTAPLIYYIEANPRYATVVPPLFEDRLEQGQNTGVTSTVSLAEVLTQPFALGRTDLTQRYRDLLIGAPHLTLVDLTAALAERAADLRARYRLRLPDAFQIAAALDRGAGYFVTNDLTLRRVSELRVLVLDDYAPPIGS